LADSVSESCIGTLAYYDVQLEVLHGWVENLFNNPWQAVYLIDEKDVHFREVRQYGREVSGLSSIGPEVPLILT